MARIRSVQPQLAKDRKLASLSIEARYTFVLCWTIADDVGLFRAEPRELLGQLYPHNPEVEGRQLEAWLSALVELGVLRWRQTRDGARVGEVVNWKRHQKIDRPSRSFLEQEIEPIANSSTEARAATSSPSMLESESPESRVLSPEPEGALRARLPAAAQDALDGYLRGAPYPDAVVQTILAEGPDTGTNAAAGKTWAIVGQALIDLRAAGKPFTPVLFRAFIRKLLEPPPANPGEKPYERMQRAADAERRKREVVP